MKDASNAAAPPEAYYPEKTVAESRMLQQKRVPSVTCSPIRHDVLSGKQPKTVKYGGSAGGGAVAGTTKEN